MAAQERPQFLQLVKRTAVWYCDCNVYGKKCQTHEKITTSLKPGFHIGIFCSIVQFRSHQSSHNFKISLLIVEHKSKKPGTRTNRSRFAEQWTTEQLLTVHFLLVVKPAGVVRGWWIRPIALHFRILCELKHKFDILKQKTLKRPIN